MAFFTTMTHTRQECTVRMRFAPTAFRRFRIKPPPTLVLSLDLAFAFTPFN